MRPLALAAVAALVCGCAGGAKTPAAAPDDGVGTFGQPGPYGVPPEAAGPINGAPTGTMTPPIALESHVFPALKFEFQVYIPKQYDSRWPCALMVFQDGRTFLNYLKTPQVFDNLIHDHTMPVTIGVFVMPGTPDGEYRQAEHRALRSLEYDTMNDTYVRFLTEELLPAAVGSYRITPDAEGWAIGGQSSGGIAAFTAAWQAPNVFRKVYTANGSFVNIRGGNAYPDLVRTATRKPLRVYLLSGTGDLDNQFGKWLDANIAMAGALAEQGYAYRFRSGEGAHSPPAQALADFPDALRWLWRGYRPR